MLYNLTDIFSSEGKVENLTTTYEEKVVVMQSEGFRSVSAAI